MRAAAGEVTEQLLAHGMAGDTPVLVVANASLPDEQLLRTRLDLLPLASRVLPNDAAAVMLIGEAVRAAVDPQRGLLQQISGAQ